MFRSKPKLPVTTEQQAWLDQSFQFLIELFGVAWLRGAPLVLPNREFFPREWEPTEDWALFAFDRVRELMHVPAGRAELIFLDDPVAELRKSGMYVKQERHAAGTYREIQTGDATPLAEIAIKYSLVNEPDQMVAVMAHEMAHVLLLGGGKIKRDLDRMEPLTDLMTVFSGFGILNANTSHIHRSGPRGWSVSSGGYLTEREYAYSLALFAWARRETAPAWDKELTKNVRTFMRETLAHFRVSKRDFEGQ